MFPDKQPHDGLSEHTLPNIALQTGSLCNFLRTQSFLLGWSAEQDCQCGVESNGAKINIYVDRVCNHTGFSATITQCTVYYIDEPPKQIGYICLDEGISLPEVTRVDWGQSKFEPSKCILQTLRILWSPVCHCKFCLEAGISKDADIPHMGERSNPHPTQFK